MGQNNISDDFAAEIRITEDEEKREKIRQQLNAVRVQVTRYSKNHQQKYFATNEKLTEKILTKKIKELNQSEYEKFISELVSSLIDKCAIEVLKNYIRIGSEIRIDKMIFEVGPVMIGSIYKQLTSIGK